MALAEITAATCAGCASTLLGHPLDTIKVHLQTHTSLNHTTDAARSLLIQGNNNPLVFFRGIGPPLVNAVLMNTVMFSVFRAVKEGIEGGEGGTEGSNGGGCGGALVAGLVSGFVTAFFSTPVDYVKIQAQLGTTTGGSSGNSANLLRRVLSVERDPFRLFRGHTANLGREGVFTMVYLGLYDRLSSSSEVVGGTGDYSLIRVAAISSLTGSLAWIASYPFDTVKTIVQGGRSSSSSQSFSAFESHVTYRDVVKRLWNIDGIRTFYKGCGASTGRAVLVTSSRMIVYEFVRGFF